MNGGRGVVKVHPIPLPRKCGVIKFEFTNREFPTPSRQSRVEEEQQWLRKQEQIRKSSGLTAEDLLPEQRNTTWLTEKGRSLMEEGNYLAALNMFSYSIALEPNLPISYIDRSSAHFELNNLHKSIEDATKALELLDERSIKELRVKAHRLRGLAICKLGEVEVGRIDVEAAEEIAKERDQVILQEIRQST